jgi:hypothetical protein
MSYTIDDYRRHIVREGLKDMTSEERSEGLSLADRLRGLSVEDIMRWLPEGVIDEIREQVRQENRDRAIGDAKQ